MKDVFDRIESIGVLPVVKIKNPGDSENLAASLLAGDLPAVEITFRTEAAAESITRIRKKFPGMLIVAGTVLTERQVKNAVDSGAEVIVAPGFNPKIAEYCRKIDIPFVPGVSTPGEIEAAMGYGLRVLKFFPSEVMGGVKMLKSLSGPYPGIKFIPTGGINLDNLRSYLSVPSVLACGGSWITPSSMISEGRFDDIAKISSRTVSEVLGFRLSGVSLKPPEKEEIESVLDFFASTFLLNKGETDTEYRAGDMIEIEKDAGDHPGRLIIAVNSMLRVRSFLERKNIEYIRKSSGELVLKDERGGFGIKIVQE